MKRFLPMLVAVIMLAATGCSLYAEEAPVAATQQPAQTAASATQAPAADSSETQPPTEINPLVERWPEFADYHEAQLLCFEQGWTGPEADKDFVAPELARRTGFMLKYEPQTITTDEDLRTKLSLMMSTGQVPDIYFGPCSYGPSGPYYRDVYNRLGEAGLIWNYAPYIKSYPDIYELLKPEILQFYDPVAKANYFIPTQNGRGFDAVYGGTYGGPYVRRDYLEILGMECPTTPEEIYEYLKACKDLPDVNGRPVIPFTMDEGLGAVDLVVNMFMPQRSGWGFDHNKDYEFYNYLFSNSEQLMRASKYVNMLYREGLLDREVLTIKRDQFMEKIVTGRVAMADMAMWDMNTFSDQAKETVPDLFYLATPDIYDRTNGYPLYPDDKWTNGVGCGSCLIVSTKLDEKALKHLLAVLDYLTGTDGQILVQMGVEGMSFEFDENGKVLFTEEFKQKTDNLDWNKASAYGVYYYQQVVNNFLTFAPVRAEYSELLREDNRAGWENKMERWNRYDPEMMPYLDQYLVEGEQEIALMPAINDAKKLFYANVLAAKDEAAVEKIVNDWAKTCKDLGIDLVIQEKIDAMQNLVIPTDLDY